MKTTILTLFSLVLCLLSPQEVNTETKPASKYYGSHFYTGNRFLGESDGVQMAYVAGFMDAFFFLMPEGVERSSFQEGWTLGQLHAVTKKWLDENPKLWNLPMSVLLGTALTEEQKSDAP